MNAWKGAALTLLFIFLAVILFNLFNPATPKTTEQNNSRTSSYDAYLETQKKRSLEYYHKADAALNKANALNDLSLSNQKRFEKILERWEKQADRMDKVMARLEKNQ